ncbi:MAG: hypothetical protein CMH57_12345 [Myxococcales bacterium]|nr:hypothetical protein [Myxococcales bacterium]
MTLGFIALIGVKLVSPETVEGGPLEAWGVSYILMAVAAITFTAGVALMLRSRAAEATPPAQAPEPLRRPEQTTPQSNPEIADWTPSKAPKAPEAPAAPPLAPPQSGVSAAPAPRSEWSDAKTPVPSIPGALSEPDSDDDSPWSGLDNPDSAWAQNTPEPFSPPEPARPRRQADGQPTPKIPQPVPSSAQAEASLESTLSSSGPARSSGPDSDSAFQAAPWMIQPSSAPRPPRAETPTPQRQPARIDTPTSPPDQELARSPSGQERLSQDQLRARLSKLRNQLDPAPEPSGRVSSTGDKPYKSSLRADPGSAFEVPTRRVGNAEIADVVSRSERMDRSAATKTTSESSELLHGLPRRPFSTTLGDLGPAKLNGLWQEYIEANHACGRDLSRLKPEAFYKHLAQNYKAIVERFSCNSVRFSIKTKNNRVSLQAVPIRRKSRD